MAKQNVSFAERHLEKIVVGMTAAILLATIVLYGIDSPNKISAGGGQVGPKEFYRQLGDAAQSAAQQVRAKQLDPVPPPPRLSGGQEQSRYAMGKVPLADLQAFTTFGITVPDAIDPGVVGDLELARILPPKAVAVREGRGLADFPQMQFQQAMQGGGMPAPPTAVTLPVDHAWAIVVAALDRKAQRELFAKAKYFDSSQQLIVAKVEAERQKLQPNGVWGPAELITGYSPVVITGKPTVQMIEQDGQKIISDQDRGFLDSYRAMLYSAEGQERILRPAVQDFLTKAYTWAPPKKLDGYNFELAEFGVRFPAEEERPGRVRPGPVGPMGPMGQRGQLGPQPPAPDRGDMEMKKKVKEWAKEANEAVTKKEWIRADELLTQILSSTNEQEREHKDALKLKQDIAQLVRQAQYELEQRTRLMGNLGMQEIGKDQEPLWLTDLSVEPGRSYRYRVRVVAFNDYAGKFSSVKDPADAERVLLAGEWSEWSEPITITPMVQVFFTDARDGGSGRMAQLKIYHFSNGDWKDLQRDYEVGQKITYKSGIQTVSYDAVISSIESNRPYRPRGRTGLEQQAVPTDVLTLVSGSGEVDERYAAEDKVRMRAFAEQVKKEKELAKDDQMGGYSPQQPRMNQFGPPGMGPPNMRGRFPGDMRGRRGAYGPEGPGS